MATSVQTGFLRDAATSVLQTSTNAGTMDRGFLRDSNGALVVGTPLTGMSLGFNRTASGALATVPFATAAAPLTEQLGFIRDAAGYLVTVTTALAAAPLTEQLGFIRDANLSLVTQ